MASAARSESLSSYLRQIGGRPQLTREQEYELARRARKGDASARDTLALSNLPFVVAVAKKFAHRGARLDDLVQEGNVGLMKAIEHFDPKKNVRFATYAVWWIRAYITRYLKDNRSQVRGGESERGSMVDFSLDTAIDEDGDTTFLDRLEEPSIRSPGHLPRPGAGRRRAAGAGQGEEAHRRPGLGHRPGAADAGQAAHPRGARSALGREPRARPPGRAEDEALPGPLSLRVQPGRGAWSTTGPSVDAA